MTNENMKQMLDDIEALRTDEGDALTIVNDNPDYNDLPNSYVECVGDWTNWETKRFSGNSLADALRNAAKARKQS